MIAVGVNGSVSSSFFSSFEVAATVPFGGSLLAPLTFPS